MKRKVQVVTVFGQGPAGGNPAPIVVDAGGMSDEEMQAVAQHYGHESGFVIPQAAGSDCDFEMRYWVPFHEMSMCGHATVGGVWLLNTLGLLRQNTLSIRTRSGKVHARVFESQHDHTVEISQPCGVVEDLHDPRRDEADILSVLGITSNELAPLPIQNACTSRVKTLIPLKSTDVLDNLRPSYKRVEQLCEQIGSTGLYPYAIADLDEKIFEARQFPKASGYPEDAATGIAAAALAFGLQNNRLVDASDDRIIIRQGRAMGCPSEIRVRFEAVEDRIDGCWIGGAVRMTADH